MLIQSFIARLSAYESENVFNPYKHTCPTSDRSDAAARRRSNLRRMLDACLDRNVDTIWVARDLGYRGGRRTGLPLTDEVHLKDLQGLLSTKPVMRATRGDIVAERTATIVWQVLHAINQPIMLWNVFPFHPHEAGNPMSNRSHKRSERDDTLPFLWDLVNLLEPSKLVAIGRDAQQALSGAPVDILRVRHPSYGGQAEFISTMFEIYGVDTDSIKQRSPKPVARCRLPCTA